AVLAGVPGPASPHGRGWHGRNRRGRGAEPVGGSDGGTDAPSAPDERKGDPEVVYHDGLRLAIDQANQAILAEAQRHPECEGMGTTLSLAISDGRSLHVANAGDSRVYVINGREIFQVTRDHSLVQELVDRGELMPEEARHHPRKNVITMALGVYDQVTPDIGCLTMEPGDNVLVCCDGLINHVEDDDIHRVVVEASDPQTACEILVSLANRGGGTDNISVIIARVPTDSP